MLCYEERLRHDEFRQMVEDIIRVGLTRYEDKFMKTDEIEFPKKNQMMNVIMWMANRITQMHLRTI